MKLVKMKMVLGDDGYINPDNISFIRNAKFGGTEIHFDKGHVLVVDKAVSEVVKALSENESITTEDIALNYDSVVEDLSHE